MKTEISTDNAKERSNNSCHQNFIMMCPAPVCSFNLRDMKYFFFFVKCTDIHWMLENYFLGYG